jgi:density-regulated protein DRP1
MAEINPATNPANEGDTEETETSSAPSVPALRHISKVEYCQFCSMPYEYCEFSACFQEKCKPYLEKHHPELVLNQSTQQLTISDNKEEKSSEPGKEKAKKAKKEKKQGEEEDSEDDNEEDDESGEEEAKPSKTEKKSVVAGQVVISKSQRSGRKFITTIVGLDKFEVDLKKASKSFSKKFACSASVVKQTIGNGSEIAIQGDLLQDLPDFITSEFKSVPKTSVFLTDKAGKKVKAF